jgi:nucleoid-associated protein YgaU
MLFWGSLAFSARLTDYSLTYTLFKPDGTPLRAKADVTFAHYQSPELISQLEDRQSPDITHHIVVKAGDTLPVLCERVYGDNRHYIDVARHNRLVDFRHLMPGRKLVFPPLD